MPLTARQRWYREVYLRSPHWRSIRLWALDRAGHRCQATEVRGRRCEETRRLDVHHRTYDHLHEEHPDDVLVVCRAHHEALDGRRPTGLWASFKRWLFA
jgi:hypothetical protein